FFQMSRPIRSRLGACRDSARGKKRPITNRPPQGASPVDGPAFSYKSPVFRTRSLMKIHEYQAKELLAAAGAKVPRGIVVASAAEAVKAFDTMGGPVVLKAQIHAGGRGKGRFKDSGTDFGGVKFIKTRDDCAKVADVMFKFPLVTRQTGADGQKVAKVLV